MAALHMHHDAREDVTDNTRMVRLITTKDLREAFGFTNGMMLWQEAKSRQVLTDNDVQIIWLHVVQKDEPDS